MTDANGDVHRPAFLPSEANGLSCSPLISDLPPFVLPVSLGGNNKKTRVWMIRIDDLGADLAAQEDTIAGARRHVSIGPARSMPFQEFDRAVQATRLKWRVV